MRSAAALRFPERVIIGFAVLRPTATLQRQVHYPSPRLSVPRYLLYLRFVLLVPKPLPEPPASRAVGFLTELQGTSDDKSIVQGDVGYGGGCGAFMASSLSV